MANNFIPHWSQTWTAAEAEKQLVDFKFEGPGWYLNRDGAILLVMPLDRPVDKMWKKGSSDPSEMFTFAVWNDLDPTEIFNSIAHAPTRQDDRD